MSDMIKFPVVGGTHKEERRILIQLPMLIELFDLFANSVGKLQTTLDGKPQRLEVSTFDRASVTEELEMFLQGCIDSVIDRVVDADDDSVLLKYNEKFKTYLAEFKDDPENDIIADLFESIDDPVLKLLYTFSQTVFTEVLKETLSEMLTELSNEGGLLDVKQIRIKSMQHAMVIF